MTTSPDPAGTGLIDDMPYLPPARPASAGPFDAPQSGSAVPGPPPPAALMMPAALPRSVASPPSSMAGSAEADRAMLAARARPTGTNPRHHAPVYGSLPAATDETVEASRRLRAEAQRRRRRNGRLGWAVTVALFGAALVVSWFVYQAFDDGGSGADATLVGPAADAEPAAVPADRGSETSADDAAGAQAQPGSWAGLTPARADGADAVDRPAYRTISYDVRIYSAVDADAPYRHFDATYDVVADDYVGLLRDSETSETTLVSFDDEWSYATGADGINRRVRRSKFSLQPEADTRLADLLDEYDVLPVAARPFTELVSREAAGDTSPSIDGTAGTIVVHELDLDAFRAADPAGHAAWWSLWATALPDSVDLVVAGSEQVQLREVTPLDLEWDAEPLDAGEIELDATSARTVIGYRVTERGVVDGVVIVSPEANTRIVYVASDYGDEPGVVTIHDDGIWVDAP